MKRGFVSGKVINGPEIVTLSLEAVARDRLGEPRIYGVRFETTRRACGDEVQVLPVRTRPIRATIMGHLFDQLNAKIEEERHD